jgi:hypothetical protein
LTILDDLDITVGQLTLLFEEKPSLRNMLLGCVAELKLRETITSFPKVSLSIKFTDHDQKRKESLYILYQGQTFAVEAQSLHTATIEWNEENRHWTGKAQVGVRESRQIMMPDGALLNTTLLLKDAFDILAVNCYAFEQKWGFIFARNSDLPTSTWRGYSETHREHLIASLIPVTFPPEPPFYSDLRLLLDEMIATDAGANPLI